MSAPGLKRQFITMVASRIFGVILQAVVIVAIGRASSVASFGHLGMVTSIGLFLGTVLDFGMSNALARAHVRQEKRLVGSILRLSSQVNVISLSLILILAGTAALTIQSPLWLFGVTAAMMIERNIETFLSIPIADGDTLTPSISLILRRTVTLVTTLGLYRLADVSILNAYTWAYMIASLVGQIHVRRRVKREGMPSLPVIKVLRICLPFFTSNITAHARYLDVTIVGIASTGHTAGLYSAGQRLASPLLVIPQTLAVLLVPHGARLSVSEVKRLASKLLAMSIAGSLLALPLLLFGRDLCTRLFGIDYGAAGPCLALTMIGLPFVAASSMLGSLLQGQGLDRFVAHNGVTFALATLSAIYFTASTNSAAMVAGAVTLTFVAKTAILAVRISRLRLPS